MSFIGVTGVVNSYSLVTASPQDLEAATVEEEDNPLNAFAVEAVSSPVMKAAQVANLLASILLIIGSVLLTGRRSSAIWWTRQGLAANVLYTLGNVAATMVFATSHPELVDAIFIAEGQTEGPTMLAFGFGTSCGAVLMIGLYAVLLRVSFRADVGSFVRREPA